MKARVLSSSKYITSTDAQLKDGFKNGQTQQHEIKGAKHGFKLESGAQIACAAEPSVQRTGALFSR